MKYKLIGSNDYTFDIYGTIAKNRGLESVTEITKYEKTQPYSPFLLTNMDLAIQTLVEFMEKDAKIHIRIDNDADGTASASILYLYLSKIYDKTKITYGIEEGKKHGIFLESLEDFDFDLLIVPDAGSSDYEQHKKLKEMGKTVIVLDHHEADKYSDDAIVVNPMLDEGYPNRGLSGAGVTYKLCEAMDLKYGFKYAEGLMDLVAVGLIADMMDSKEPENRYYMMKGIDNIQNGFLKAIQTYFGKKVKANEISFVSYYVAPLINSVHRLGSVSDKLTMFKCFVDGETFNFQTKPKKGFTPTAKTLIETSLPYFLDMKIEQDNNKKEMLLDLDIKILDSIAYTFINAEDRTLTGVLANEIAEQYQKPTLVLINNEDGRITGSGRNFSDSPMDDFRQCLEDNPHVDFARGHDGAFGVAFWCLDSFQKAIELHEVAFKDVMFEKIYKVDFIISPNNVTTTMADKVASLNRFYGRGFEQPRVIVEGVEVKKEDLTYNDKMTMVKFPINSKQAKLVAINFNSVQDIVDQVEDKGSIVMNILGKFSINEWMGKITYQLIVDDYEVLCYNNREKKLRW